MRGPAACESYAHCRDLVRRTDKDRFLSGLFAPHDRRDHLYALYAFNAEVAGVRDKVSDALPGEVRLQWWCEALAGCGHGEVSRHPVAAALLDTLDRLDLPAEPLIDLVEARSFDLYDEPMATLADLESYVVSTASIPFHMSAAILGAADDAAVRDTLRDGGLAYGITGLLRAFGHCAARGKIYVPEELLARNGVPPHDILIGRRSPALDAALAELRSIARHHLDDARARQEEVPPQLAPAMLPLALVQPYLDRMDKAGCDPFASCTIPQWRRQWILWRAARKAGA
jgi:15-cis-phytoene synthase